MEPCKQWGMVIVVLAIVVASIECRRVKLKSATVTEEPQPPRQVLYYADEQQSEEDTPVLIARQPTYSRSSQSLPSRARQETSKSPPVQTIRNFNKLNDDGSFTFGYEAADGSFKEETRGTDCVVRGKYGYVDPDGNKREFTYVSGNPCDPNAISQEEEDEVKGKASSEEENIPNIPRRQNFIVRPSPPARSRPATTLFQQSFNNDDSSSQEDVENQLVEIKQSRPVFRVEPQVVHTTNRPITRTFPSATTRFATKAETEPATTYRPQAVQFSVTPSSTTVPKAARIPFPSTPVPNFFDDQFKKFQLDSNVIPNGQKSGNPLYSTELVFDPASGQYNTIVYQQVPKHEGVNLNQRLPFIPETTPRAPIQPVTARLFPSTTPASLTQQQFIQQQQQTALVRESQQLYNQQLKQQQLQQQQQQFQQQNQQQRELIPQPIPQTTLLKQNPHRFPQPIIQRFPPEPKQHQVPEQFQQQPFFYVNPALRDDRQSVASGQIEAFLRGHSVQF